MDTRIGKIMKDGVETFYAFVNHKGYDAEPFFGTLEEVEVKLGLREAVEVVAVVAEVKAPAKTTDTYTVHVHKQFPAWDEVDGVDVEVEANSKKDACDQVRAHFKRECIMISMGQGHVYFKATKKD